MENASLSVCRPVAASRGRFWPWKGIEAAAHRARDRIGNGCTGSGGGNTLTAQALPGLF
jgi:hypothetical protein